MRCGFAAPQKRRAALADARLFFPMNDRTPTTSETLLRDLAARPDSPRAEEFARLYEPVLRRYVAQARIGHAPIQPADRDDLVQEVFLAVRSALPGFRYESGRSCFRAYLRRAVRNAVLRLQRRPATVPPETAEALPAPSRDDRDSEEVLLRIWTLALARVFRSGRFSPNTQAVFRRVALEGESPAVVGREFKLKPNAVYQIRNRILRAVREELDRFGRGRLSASDLLDALESASDS